MDQLPAWDNTTEYAGIQSADYNSDFSKASELVVQLESLNTLLLKQSGAEQIQTLQKLSALKEQALTLIANLNSYVGCERSLDLKNEKALKAKSQIDSLLSGFAVASNPSNLFLKKCDESVLDAYLASESTKDERFALEDQRKMKVFALSQEEESTLAQFQRYGRDGWSDLYSNISGALSVDIPSVGKMGAAQAAGYLGSNDPKLREEAWRGLQAAWSTVAVPCAAILNNLVGYRLEEYRKRSHTRKMGFLDTPLFESRIEPETLEAMLGAVQDRIEVPHRALEAMAAALGKDKLSPWDALAPSPRQASKEFIPYSKALTMISEAFASVDEGMGEFVQMMSKNNWIEGRILPNKVSGAHCTGFLKSNSPRVFQSYSGTMKDVTTLAHELGHAYHSWVMKDLPFSHKDYPMTLAETASIFSETLLAEQIAAKADVAGKFGVAWENAADAVSLLLNIPFRFEFEKSLYEARGHGALSPGELTQLADTAWKKWFGDRTTESESLYWMTKMHFSFAGVSFYNYPYTFGYLFALGIYSQRERLGAKFHQAYVDILRDTGRMSAEDLIMKHLGMDIRQKKFWLDSLKIVEDKVASFEKMLAH